MWIVRKFPEAWGIYNENTLFSRLLEDHEIALIKTEFPQLTDETVTMIMVPVIESFPTGNASLWRPGLPNPEN
ncbi:hypothetical protein [Chitinophaga varians]|uniref:hypothetical protein n=1 Tax=Chitinophaga varians TaxID=2202339 RepID=UPI00165F6725|nr:hypothetical protein [Chitinophaga varians]MBC9909108.1 hypothetical protein [Chitinophaga varians]